VRLHKWILLSRLILLLLLLLMGKSHFALSVFFLSLFTVRLG